MNVNEIEAAIHLHTNVESLHDLHVWEISSGFASLSAHVLVPQGDDCHAIRREIEEMLNDRFHIEHTTLQVDHAARTSGLAITAAPEHPPRGDWRGSKVGMLRLDDGLFMRKIISGAGRDDRNPGTD